MQTSSISLTISSSSSPTAPLTKVSFGPSSKLSVVTSRCQLGSSHGFLIARNFDNLESEQERIDLNEVPLNCLNCWSWEKLYIVGSDHWQAPEWEGYGLGNAIQRYIQVPFTFKTRLYSRVKICLISNPKNFTFQKAHAAHMVTLLAWNWSHLAKCQSDRVERTLNSRLSRNFGRLVEKLFPLWRIL